MTVRLERNSFELIADGHRGETPLVFVLRRLVATLLVRGEEAPERDDGPGGAELDVFLVGFRSDPQTERATERVLHL